MIVIYHINMSNRITDIEEFWKEHGNLTLDQLKLLEDELRKCADEIMVYRVISESCAIPLMLPVSNYNQHHRRN